MKLLLTLSIFILSFLVNAQEIKWFSLSEAEAEMKKNPEKPLFIDFYTSWCGWCKKMDASTFKEAEVIKHLNENYIPVKFDAESKDQYVFRGKTYKFVKVANGRGVNSFAYFSLGGRLSYPAYGVMTNAGKMDRILLGFMPKDKFLENLSVTQ